MSASDQPIVTGRPCKCDGLCNVSSLLPGVRCTMADQIDKYKPAEAVEFSAQVTGGRFWTVRIDDFDGLTIFTDQIVDGEPVVIHRTKDWAHTAAHLAMILAEHQMLIESSSR